ncbi:alpha-1,3-mannosyl-glycoprotein 4-beta-N-acetylglucosaminyltransferase A [Trichoplusia ni]|uniref:Alpha-1,3-mannosyl-glycoprotein 4-beta-N-acetylglucosaminyltransferase A n=1 Tax=Trichoplusia ni TaxID=7111 RepID=A0A7E5WXK1_TRINI|nr:alpha-1,3-mannosyl-glycoprotein 4-beta-N-acetylglucosaminyltransferase A [Trichoplusia ni]
MEEMLAGMQSHLQFLETQYRGRHEDVITLQAKLLAEHANSTPEHAYELPATTMTPEVMALLKNMSGTRAAAGIYTKNLQQLRTPFVYQLLPHLMNDPYSLKPVFHMRGGRTYADIVVGVPTVKRDKESYLLITLRHLVAGLSDIDVNTTLIVVMIGETDLEYILHTARQIENMFPKQVEMGLIEVLSPPPAYYPDFDALPLTLGDSMKRVKWRTKQNLDTIYLMAYAQSKGTFYLMLEDDVIAKNNYIQEIKQFTSATSVANPRWFFIEYCHVGGIGKFFRSSDLIHFITYVQLFYNNMPIDWLLESYLADRVCTIEKTSKMCAEAKEKIRPKFKSSLFQHIGLYSSLKGKIQKVKDSHYGTVPTFYPHLANPKLQSIKSDIVEHADHSLRRAYEGQTYFWGVKPKKGDAVEFWFHRPVIITHYIFRSGNVEHVSDKFYDTTVEALPGKSNSNFTPVGIFDEFGLAEGDLKMGPVAAFRLRVNSDSRFWVILCEIDLKVYQVPESR